MVISKVIAEQIAHKLLAKKHDTCKKLEEEFTSTVQKIYMKQLPISVKNMFKKHKDWMKTDKYKSLFGHGFNHKSVTFSEPLPCSSVGGGRIITLSEEDGVILFKKDIAITEMRKANDVLFSDIVTTLLSLKTYKRITENFPEAVPFLPTQTSYALAVNIDHVREQLKS